MHCPFAKNAQGSYELSSPGGTLRGEVFFLEGFDTPKSLVEFRFISNPNIFFGENP